VLSLIGRSLLFMLVHCEFGHNVVRELLVAGI
jgi:hypothetical protein